MTLDAGKWIWPNFQKTLLEAATPLLLDNDQDLDQITAAWRRSCVIMTRHEAIRILKADGIEPSESRVQGKQRRLIEQTGLGHAEGGRVVVLSGLGGSVVEGSVSDASNRCERKVDDRYVLVPPKGFELPPL